MKKEWTINVTFPKNIQRKFIGIIVALALVAVLLFAQPSRSVLVSDASVQANKYIIITFDDNNIQKTTDQTVQIMDSYGFKGVAMTVVDWAGVDNPVYAHILAEGWEIGSHSWNHLNMNQLSQSQLIHEISDSKAWLEQAFGTSVISFGYPGSDGSSNQTVLNALANAGYLYARESQYHVFWTGERSLQVVAHFCDTYSTADDYTVEVQKAINAANTYGVAVIAFHGVNPTYDPPYTLSPSQFTYCLGQIQNAGLSVVTFKEWDQISHGTPSPPVSTFKIDVTVVGQGSVTRNAAEPYMQGQAVSLTANAQTGWTFQAWTGDIIGAANPASLTMTKNMTVTVTFTQNSQPPPPPPVNSITVSVTLQPFDMNLQLILNSGTAWTAPTTITMMQRSWTFQKWADGSTNATRTFTSNSAVEADYT